MENRRNWNFNMSDGGSWVWQHTLADGSEETSGGFPTLRECIAYATDHGYVVYKSEERRKDLAREGSSAQSR